MTAATKGAEVELWDTAEVTIATKKGDTKDRGLVHPRAPGLAVTMAAFGTFDVTHVASGMIVAKGYQRVGSACAVLAALAPCADWRLPATELLADLKAHRDEPANVPRWTITAKGVNRPQTKGEIVQGARNHHFFDEFPWESGADDPMNHAMDILATLPPPTSGATTREG